MSKNAVYSSWKSDYEWLECIPIYQRRERISISIFNSFTPERFVVVVSTAQISVCKCVNCESHNCYYTYVLECGVRGVNVKNGLLIQHMHVVEMWKMWVNKLNAPIHSLYTLLRRSFTRSFRLFCIFLKAEVSNFVADQPPKCVLFCQTSSARKIHLYKQAKCESCSKGSWSVGIANTNNFAFIAHLLIYIF